MIAGAEGLAFLTVVKAGVVLSGHVGSGLVVGRTADGKWSAPSAIMSVGSGWGLQVGGEVVDSLVVIRSRDALEALTSSAQLSLSGSASATAGTAGRQATRSGVVNERDAAALAPVSRLRVFSRTRGLFAGVALETGLLISRPDLNLRFYGCDVSARSLLGGSHPRPRAAQALYAALDDAAAEHLGVHLRAACDTAQGLARQPAHAPAAAEAPAGAESAGGGSGGGSKGYEANPFGNAALPSLPGYGAAGEDDPFADNDLVV